MKKFIGPRNLMCLTLALLMLALSACGAGGSAASDPPSAAPAATAQAAPEPAAPTEEQQAPPAAPALDPVTLTWYVVSSPQDDQQTVMDAVNKVFQEKINASLDVVMIDWGAYDDRMRVAIATGEEYDMCFTSSWTNPYGPNAEKGAYYPLDDLLERYGQNILAQVPEKYWPAAKVNGKIYGVLNYQIYAMYRGIGLPQELMDKYGLKREDIKKMADLTPYLEAVKQGEPDLVPFLGISDNAMMPELNDYDTGFAYDFVAGNGNNPLAIKVDDASLKVFNGIETDEFWALCRLYRDWYEKGYVRKDVASITDFAAEARTGKYASYRAGGGPGTDEARTSEMGGAPWIVQTIVPPFSNTGTVIAALTSISGQSKNPERAMMALDLLFADKDLYDLLCLGIEGVHYTKPTSYSYSPIDGSGYSPGIQWVFGSWFNGLLSEGQPEDTWEQHIKGNDEAYASPLMGFVYSTENVQTEFAQMSALMSEYLPGLMTGSVDPEAKIPELLGKLEGAGIKTLIEDAQKQIDAWKASQG